MTDLWTLNIAFRQHNAQLKLMFDSGDKARAGFDALDVPRLPAEDEERGLAARAYDPTVEVKDTYGTTATINRDAVLAKWMTCLGDEANGVVAQGLLNARAQAKYQKAMAADDTLCNPIIQPSQGQHLFKQ